jgi:dipeptidyl aminopeptidase/acylaminoacyl peptidase
VVRDDLARAATPSITHPGDERVTIPASGFVLAGTVTRPAAATRLRLPAVVLVGPSTAPDRDATTDGVPVLGLLAGALADNGFLAVRYDRRGTGGSGGRAESATLDDYADDVRSAVRYLRRRADVDRRRVAVLGYGDGAAVALAAARDRDIAALVLVAGMGTTGAELVLEQQRLLLDRSRLTAAEREERIALQQRIHEAVLTGRGWEALPPEVRRQADTPWFRSLLAFDPAKAMARTRQPLLVLHGGADDVVPAHHAEKLAALARARRKAGPVAVEILEGVGHELTAGAGGDGRSEARLSDEIVRRLVAWLRDAL